MGCRLHVSSSTAEPRPGLPRWGFAAPQWQPRGRPELPPEHAAAPQVPEVSASPPVGWAVQLGSQGTGGSLQEALTGEGSLVRVCSTYTHVYTRVHIQKMAAVMSYHRGSGRMGRRLSPGQREQRCTNLLPPPASVSAVTWAGQQPTASALGHAGDTPSLGSTEPDPQTET